jgi:hypothetical protein
MTMGSDPLGTFFGQTSGGMSAQLNQQLQMFLQALQFQQQQAALQQAGNYGGQYGFAPGGNWMTWGAGGPTQPPAGTPTQQQLQLQQALLGSQLQNALAIAAATGQFAAPAPNQYAPGTVLSAPSQTGGGNAYGIVQQDGSVQMVSTEALDQLAQQRGTTAQAMIDRAAPVDFGTLQRLSQGPPTGPSQQTQQAQQQAYNQALQAAQITGSFTNPLQSADALLQQGQAMNGQSFYSLPQEEQQFWLQYNQNNPQAAAQQWARGVNSALQASGYTNPAAGPQQTLQAINQAAQLSGMYQGAPTEVAREFNLQNALAQGQLTGVFQGAPTEAAREFQQNLALQQGQLGQQYLSTAAQLQGPQNTFQLSNYLRGAQANPNVPVYLRNLMSNQGTAGFQAPGATAPTPVSATGLIGQMGGTNSDWMPQPAAGSAQWSGGMGQPPWMSAATSRDLLTPEQGGLVNAPGGGSAQTPNWGTQLPALQKTPGASSFASQGPAMQMGQYQPQQYTPQSTAGMWSGPKSGAGWDQYTQQQQAQNQAAAGQLQPQSQGGLGMGYFGTAQPAQMWGSSSGQQQATPSQQQYAQSATPGWDYNQTLGTIGNIMQRGAQGLRPGALEGLSSDELAAFGSGLGALGGTLPSFLQQYQQSRVGQRSPISGFSLG